MRFLNPWLLLLLVFVFAPFVAHWQLKGSRILFSNWSGIRKTVGLYWQLPLLIDAIAIFLLVLALARPVNLDKVITPPVEGKDIMIALDVSGSMEALDFKPNNRLEAAKQVIAQFIKERTNDRIGLVFFASDAYLQVPLTMDYGMFTTLMTRLKTGVIEDGTAIGNGLGLALSRLDESKTKSRILILLTDGANNAGNVSPDNAAEIAKKIGVKIYPILIGTDKPVQFPAGKDFFGRMSYRKVKMKTDPALMRRLAQVTGGTFFQSLDTKDLQKSFAEIDTLEKSPIPSKTYRTYKEYAQQLIIAAMILILLARIFALIFPLFPEVER